MLPQLKSSHSEFFNVNSSWLFLSRADGCVHTIMAIFIFNKTVIMQYIMFCNLLSLYCIMSVLLLSFHVLPHPIIWLDSILSYGCNIIYLANFCCWMDPNILELEYTIDIIVSKLFLSQAL